AEPPQDLLPYGRWAERLRTEFLAAAAELEDVGEPGELAFYPDRSWHGRTWVPVTAPTSTDLEIVGFVSFRPGADGDEATAFTAHADATEETAARHPEWQLDLNDEVVGSWRGEQRQVAAMTLVWGTPLVPGGAVATAARGAEARGRRGGGGEARPGADARGGLRAAVGRGPRRGRGGRPRLRVRRLHRPAGRARARAGRVLAHAGGPADGGGARGGRRPRGRARARA